jgi:hypothetical protein
MRWIVKRSTSSEKGHGGKTHCWICVEKPFQRHFIDPNDGYFAQCEDGVFVLRWKVQLRDPWVTNSMFLLSQPRTLRKLFDPILQSTPLSDFILLPLLSIRRTIIKEGSVETLYIWSPGRSVLARSVISSSITILFAKCLKRWGLTHSLSSESKSELIQFESYPRWSSSVRLFDIPRNVEMLWSLCSSCSSISFE